MNIHKILRWVWVALREHLDRSKWKWLDRLIQQQLKPESILTLVLTRSVTILVLWGGSIFALTVVCWGLTFAKDLVEQVRSLIIQIPKIIFWVVAEIVKLLKKFF